VSRGASIMGAMVSPLTGADGNVEFVVVGRAPGPEAAEPLAGRQPLDPVGIVAALDAAVDVAAGAAVGDVPGAGG